jgi:C1A family cysteine protease
MSIETISLQQIKDALAKEGDPWEAGVTTMSVLLPDEQQLRLGVKPPPGEASIDQVATRSQQNRDALRARAAETITAPSAYDLRNVGGKNFITEVTDQGNCGSCVAFGAVAAVEGRLRVQRNNPALAVNLSEAHLFFVYAKAAGYNCDTGWWPEYALDAFKQGVVDEACYPYDLNHREGSLCSNAPERLTRITGYTSLTSNPAQMKEWIATKGPVSACFVVYNDFFSYKSGIYRHVTGAQAGGHCVTIVGYNDNPGYWICKNSWGTSWGESGFFNIAYGECGIDSWRNHGVDGIQNTGWQNNARVTGLWTIDQQRNAWAYFQNIGWRKISNETDAIFYDMLTDLIAAKASGRAVNFYEVDSVIKQAYVF